MTMDPLPLLEWRVAAASAPPGEDELHLWQLDLDDAVGWNDDAALAALSPAQRDRHARLHLSLHRRRYLRAQFGCRMVLAGYLGLCAADVRYRYGAAGKPALADDLLDDPAYGGPGLSFNLTTSDDLAVLAVSRRLPIGVDSERLRPRPDIHAVARRMFTPATVRALARLPEQDQLPAFYRQWTALESGVKADGRGLARHREPNLPGLRVGHFGLRTRAGGDYICAVARQQLPDRRRWQALLPDLGAAF
jgi:4'-phosphopantetheinyl transferase